MRRWQKVRCKFDTREETHSATWELADGGSCNSAKHLEPMPVVKIATERIQFVSHLPPLTIDTLEADEVHNLDSTAWSLLFPNDLPIWADDARTGRHCIAGVVGSVGLVPLLQFPAIRCDEAEYGVWIQAME